jgi:glutamate--cysteine ligase
MPDYIQALRMLSAQENLPLLNNVRRGIEKESLRVTAEGTLSTSPHPRSLGSALTHPRITTDFSEALLELITPAGKHLDETLTLLDEIHRVIYRQIDDELLWVSSMPCAIGNDADIPIARYGSSNVARMKEVYRLGLGVRYGRTMQTVSGIHYNWSAPDEAISLLQTACGNGGSLQDFKTRTYFGLIRNFRRHTWLLLYLLGATPAVCRSFVKGREHHLEKLDQEGHTLYAPYGTSLRMGDLGYQSSAQESLYVCYNHLDNYIRTLKQALDIPYEPYEKLGIKDNDGHYQQLNTHLLQIENEFYSTIRPKRTTESGEAPLKALRTRGIEYIEVRCIDLNPFEPTGISQDQCRFLDVYLLYSMLKDSPGIDIDDNRELLANQMATVYNGRAPGMQLNRNGTAISLRQWAGEVLTDMIPVAELLDNASAGSGHSQALQTMLHRVEDPDATPSARIVAELSNNNISYFQWALAKSREHKAAAIANPISDAVCRQYSDMAVKSLADQEAVERQDQDDFERYLTRYFAQHKTV